MPEGISEGIGASVRRKEDKKFTTGKGRYTDDINRPGQLHAFFIRSDVAHAKIKNIDITKALKSDGVATPSDFSAFVMSIFFILACATSERMKKACN